MSEMRRQGSGEFPMHPYLDEEQPSGITEMRECLAECRNVLRTIEGEAVSHRFAQDVKRVFARIEKVLRRGTTQKE